jgi:hypothetical protein
MPQNTTHKPIQKQQRTAAEMFTYARVRAHTHIFMIRRQIIKTIKS